MSFPVTRHHRYRSTPAMRAILQETHVRATDLVMPIFVNENISAPIEIKSMPGIYQLPLSGVAKEATEIFGLGIPAVILFGIPKNKDAKGSGAFAQEGVVQKAITLIKKALPELIVIADACLCEYTADGHCGYHQHGHLNNDETLVAIQKVALSQAKAGADIIAPSGMMDGMVSAIRSALDKASFERVGIMAYSIKYASAFYGPFRDAAGSRDAFIDDRKHHQMNPAQKREAWLEAAQDVEEGADWLMVKPALAYLDVLQGLRSRFDLPLVAYNVSGEYSMIKVAASAGVINEAEAVKEILISMKRAGADLIITYFAKQIAPLLSETK